MLASIDSPTIGLADRFPRRMHLASAYSSTTSHCTQEAVVDLNDFLHRLARYPISCRGPRVCGYDNSSLKSECQRSGTMGNLDGAVRV